MGLKFSMYRLSLSFFSISRIIACRCEFDSFPVIWAAFKESTRRLPSIGQKCF